MNFSFTRSFSHSFTRNALRLTFSPSLAILCYFPFYWTRIGLRFRVKATERPLPDEIAALARSMGLKICKTKTIPKNLQRLCLWQQGARARRDKYETVSQNEM
jgi:hypothetical protein